MKHAIAVVTIVSALLVGHVSAQTTPNFAGKWTLVPDSTGGGGRGMGGVGQSATIVQDANTLTVTRTTQMGEFTASYKLDGSESKNTMNMAGTPIEQLSTAKWDGGKLTINTRMDLQGTPIETTLVLSLDPSGNLLVESTRPDFQGGGAPITTKMTYRRQ